MGRRTRESKARGGPQGPLRERRRAVQGPILRYTVRFVAVTAVLFALSLSGPARAFADGCASACAWLANGLLFALGQGTRLSGLDIHSARFGVTVLAACTGGELVAFLWAGILAFPASLRAKAAGLLGGTALLFGLNVARIACVFLVGVYAPRLFHAIHEVLWPGLLVLGTLGLGLAWVRWAAPGRAGALASDASLVRNLRRSAVVFMILILPWPGLSDACGRALRGLGDSAFASSAGSREVSFERQGPDGTRIEIANRDLLRADGSGPVRNLDFDTLSLVWRPVCLFLVLVLATAMPLRGRLQMLALGAVALLAYTLATLGFAIWNESTAVALTSLGPAWKSVAAQTQDFLVGCMGLAVPAVIWLAALGWTAGRLDLPPAPRATNAAV